MWATAADAATRLLELVERKADTGAGTDSDLPRAVIVSGITQNQFHGLMAACRQTGMAQAL